MGTPRSPEEAREREAREAAERKRAAIIVLGAVLVGVIALVVASVMMMP